jgi:hypothetical protein
LRQFNYVGHLENINDVEYKLSEVLNEKITFSWLNKGPLEDYYSMDIDVQRFNAIFEEDYELLKDFYRSMK